MDKDCISHSYFKNIQKKKKKKELRKELETTLLKIPTNQELYTQIYITRYPHSGTHTHNHILSCIHSSISSIVVYYNRNNLQHSPSSW